MIEYNQADVRERELTLLFLLVLGLAVMYLTEGRVSMCGRRELRKAGKGMMWLSRKIGVESCKSASKIVACRMELNLKRLKIVLLKDGKSSRTGRLKEDG